MTHRLERILKLLSLLQSGTSFNALQLAQETGVHRRTVFRDVALLRAAGIPIRCDPDTACYSLVSAPEFLAEGIRAAELTRCLQMACLGNFLLRGNIDVIGRAIQKLASGLPEEARGGVEQLLRTCRLPLASESTVSTPEPDHELLAVITRAIRLQNQLMLLIHDGGRELQPLKLGNPRLVFATRGLLLVGQSVPDGRALELSLSAICEATPLDAASELRRQDHFSPINYAPPREPPSSPSSPSSP